MNFATSGSGTDAANTQDFAGNLFPTGTVTFANGVRTQDVTIPVNGDTTPENDEGFTVTVQRLRQCHDCGAYSGWEDSER